MAAKASAQSTVALPTNFLGLRDIDNLSLAGVGVWLICVVVQSFFPGLNSYFLRIIALTISLFWSICQFAKNKKWNNGASYLFILINACLIFISASGMNSVTRQNPLNGEMINSNLDTLKKAKITKASILDLSEQTDWFPDYKMISYIDTLKLDLLEKNNEINNLKNLFSYFKDDVKSATKDTGVLAIIKKFNLKDENDSNYLEKLKQKYEKKIDSLKRVITRKDADYSTSISTTTYSIEYEGKKLNFSQYVDRSFKLMDSLEFANTKLKGVLNFIKQTKKIPSNIDSL